MKLAIMQPYFFPYIGYYQLVAAVDKFVFLDDVNYQRGWMNRNRLIISGAVQYFTLPLSGASQNQKICDIRVEKNNVWREKIKRSVSQSYSKAPHFKAVFALLNEVLNCQSDSLSDYAKMSIRIVVDYLGLPTRFGESSRVYQNAALTGQSRILDIARQEQTAEYYNLPGGIELYEPAIFQAQNIKLHFIQPNLQPYPQATQEFQRGLSMLDVLMLVEKQMVLEMLRTPRQAV